MDFSQEEGLLGSDAGTVDLTAAAALTLTLPSRLGVRAWRATSRSTSNMALAELPASEMDGRQAPVRGRPARTSWPVQVPAGLPLGIARP